MKLKIILFLLIANLVVVSAKKSNLFSSKLKNNWIVVLSDKSKNPDDVFSFENEILKIGSATTGYIRTKKMYSNFSLQVEWRWTKKAGNSGVLVYIQQPDTVWPACFQVQQKADAAGDIICMNGLWAKECTDNVKFTIPKMQPSSEKPVGEWNTLLVKCTKNSMTVYINGVLQNVVTELTKTKGYIGLQAEGREMEFRNLIVM